MSISEGFKLTFWQNAVIHPSLMDPTVCSPGTTLDSLAHAMNAEVVRGYLDKVPSKSAISKALMWKGPEARSGLPLKLLTPKKV